MIHYFKFALLFILFCLSSFLSAQEMPAQDELKNPPKEWIYKVAKFRDYLLRDNENALYELKALLEKWETNEVVKREQDVLAANISYWRVITGMSDEKLTIRINEFIKDNDGINTLITTTDLKTIANNYELLQLVNMGILKDEYPFVIDPETEFFKELAFYDLVGIETVGEIGAGFGMFGMMLKLIYTDLDMYLNEIDLSAYKLMTSLSEKHKSVINTNKFYPLIGSKKSTYLEYIDLNTVIIRNSFHHFTKKEKMLTSLKKSLNEYSEVFLLEGLKEYHKDEHDCQLEMSKPEILDMMSANGFVLVAEIVLRDQILLKFKLST